MCMGKTQKSHHKHGAYSNNNALNNLNMSYWNIHGYKSKIIGNKLLDPDFLSEMRNSDIIGLSETHTCDDTVDHLNIPGFIQLKYKNRKKGANNVTPGGISVFARQNLSEFLQPVETQNEDIIWIKIKKEKLNLPNDIYLGSLYISPHKGKQTESVKIKTLGEDIISFQRKGGEILLLGDTNARTSNFSDTLEPDKYDIGNQREQINIPPRNSEDKCENGRGKELIELCKSLDLCILNGRKNGDLFGNFTSFQWNGSGVVDYAITSQFLFSKISSFNVGEYKPWISDHCAIHQSLQLQGVNATPKAECELRSIPKSWYWDSSSNKKFTAILKSKEMSENLQRIIQIADINDMTTEINNILITTANNSGIKPKKHRTRLPNITNSPWYDQECIHLKSKIKKTAKLLKCNPRDNKIREDLFTLQRRYKCTVKRKKDYIGKTF